MDKYEYNVKSDQIKKLYSRKDYVEAARIADEIDWYKVKDNTMINKVADIYEATKQYEKAREILLIAYERSPLGRQLAYKLTILALRRKDFVEADEFYQDFVEMSPTDVAQYLLKYRIARAKGEDIDILINILEAYVEVEMDERWQYELAKLYHEAGYDDKCITMCDELVLWFNEGKYVEKAKNLKKMITGVLEEYKKIYTNDNILQVPEELINSKPEKEIFTIEEDEKAQSEEIDKNSETNVDDNQEEADEEFAEEIDEAFDDEKEEVDIYDADYDDMEMETSDEMDDNLEADNIGEDIDDLVNEENIEEVEELDDEISENVEEDNGEMSDLETFAKAVVEESEEVDYFAEEEDEEEIVEEYVNEDDIGESDEVIRVKEALAAAEEAAAQARRAAELAEKLADETRKRAVELGISVPKKSKKTTNGGRKISKIPDTKTYKTPMGRGSDEYAGLTVDEIRKKLDEEEAKYGKSEAELDTKIEIFEFDKKKEGTGKIGDELTKTAEIDIDEIEIKLSNTNELYNTANIQAALAESMEKLFAATENELTDNLKEAESEKNIEDKIETETSVNETEVADDRVETEVVDDRVETEVVDEDTKSEDKKTEETNTEDEKSEDTEENVDALEFDLSESHDEFETEFMPNISGNEPTKVINRDEINKLLKENTKKNLYKTSPLPPMLDQEEDGQIGMVEETVADEQVEGQMNFEEVLFEMEKAKNDKLNENVDLTENLADVETLDDVILETGEEYESEEVLEEKITDEIAENNTIENETSKEEVSEENVSEEQNLVDETEENSNQESEDVDMQNFFADLGAAVRDAISEETQEESKEIEEDAIIDNENIDPDNVDEKEEKSNENAKAENETETNEDSQEEEDLEENEVQGDNYSSKNHKIPKNYRHLFNDFVNVGSMEEEISDTLDNLINKFDMDGTSKTNNVVITGSSKIGKTTLGLSIIKAANRGRNRAGRRVAKVKATVLNKRGVSLAMTQILGTDLIIEQAGNLMPNTIVDLTIAMKNYTEEMLIILEDDRAAIDRMFQGNPELKDLFTNRLDIEEMEISDMVRVAKEYALSNMYEIDEIGELALSAKLDDISGKNPVISIEDIQDVVDEAIEHANRFSFGKLFGKKKGKNEMTILSEEDFL